MNINFSNQHIVITAGASGIGYEIAKGFASYGAEVYVCDIDKEKVEALKTTHTNIHGFVADVGNNAQVEAFFQWIRTKTSSLNVLVNNAGISGPTALTEDVQPEEWDRTLAVNLGGMFYTTRLAIPMIKQMPTGSIVNISSNAAYFGFPFRIPYTASKWAAIGFTKTLAMELGGDKIRVNAVCPGSVDGPRIDAVIAKEAQHRQITFEEVKASYERQVSLRSFVNAADVVNTILFICSPFGAMISGQALGVDGHTETLTNY